MLREEDQRELKVRDVMSHPIITVDEEAPVTEIVKNMAELEIGSVVITADGKPSGIVTERDVALKVLLKNKRADEVRAKEIMTSPLITVAPDMSLDEASEIAAEKRIKRLPVVENGVVIGLVSLRNILTQKPEYVKRFYPKVRLLASGWTLDRLERELSDCEMSLLSQSDRSFEEALKEVYDELQELVGTYDDDTELIELFERIEEFYSDVAGKGDEKGGISAEEQRKRLDEILREFRHITYLRKQQSLSSFAGVSSRFGDYRHQIANQPRLPYKRTR
ncbi:MAG: CBS domain-containing protein [Candidatus Methanospirareceae archaeon]